ncbi:predicted protein [Streptomyces viridosporus ATCC 14672]|uniref:Predicted protein n=1 Tax=Streptomyces viridosporus (strain ATCC 14672 / DSM 40746 / JCM 4963 / KCTC 9882 / NRRL B-12104 / FH 1290) TaxID=566461 RepID=D6A2N4_STRV1|nr:predicted protein [Streptomyces viridosporus ATCC 14672]
MTRATAAVRHASAPDRSPTDPCGEVLLAFRPLTGPLAPALPGVGVRPATTAHVEQGIGLGVAQGRNCSEPDVKVE